MMLLTAVLCVCFQRFATPGIAFTMGIRDFVQGDYLSGTIRMIDALLIAASIAIGTGLVLSLYAFLKGVAVV